MATPKIYDFFRKITAVDATDTLVGTAEADHTRDELTIKGGDNIVLSVDAATDKITIEADDTTLFVPIGTTTLRHQQGLDIHDVNLVGGYGVDIVRNSAGELELQAGEGDTNIVWVSKSQGNDTHDGINAPVATIKKACQIASEIAYQSTVTQTASLTGARELLDANIEFIKDEVIQHITDNFPSLTYNTDKCKRDTGYIANAALYDVQFGGNSASRLSAELYFTQGSAEVIANQLAETISANTFLKQLVMDVLNQITVTPLQSVTSQTLDANITVGNADVTSISAGIQIVIDALTAGNTNSLPALVKPTLSITPTTIKIASGDYLESNPIIVPDGVSLVGDSLRTVIIRPLNANKNMFSLRNGSYVTQITFRDHLDANGAPDWTWNFTFGFDDILDSDYDRGSYRNLSSFKPVVTTSPYIFNSSLISFLGGSGVDVNGDLVEEPNQPAQPLELELGTDTTPGLPKQGKSMIGAAYTMLTFGGTGWLIRNQAYSQLVSCFQIFAKNGIYTQNGGYCSVTNSATNFGLYALRSIGQMPVSFEFDRPIIHGNGIFEGKQSFKVIGSKRAATEHFIIRIINGIGADITNNHRQNGTSLDFDSSTDVNGNLITLASHGFVGGEKVVYRNGGNKDIVGLLDRNEYYVFVANANEIGLFEDVNSVYRAVPIQTSTSQTHNIVTPDEEWFVDEIIDEHSVYQELTLAAGTYNFNKGQSITGDEGGIPLAGIVSNWDSVTRKLTISNEKVQIGDTAVRNLFSLTATITQDHTSGTPVQNINISSFEDITNLYTSEFTISSTYGTSTFQNIANTTTLDMHLHRPSIVNSSAHTWEYAGSGIDYNALPENGGQTVGAYQQYRNQEGRVYTSGTNELGDFLVGDFITAENKTGNIIFKNKVTITELDSLSLTLSDVTINEISDDIGLGDNDLNGPLHSRLVTQLAVRSFLDNRLGDFIDKSVSTNAVPSAIAQLNSAGQLNPELIPATRSFASYVVDSYEGRLIISEDIPAGDSQSGDIAIENYLEDVLTLSSAVTVVKGETITQANSGATGVVKQNLTSSTSLKLVSVNGTFTTNSADTLSGSTSGALSAYPTVVDADTEQQDSYFLNRDTSSQFLILEAGSYSFTNSNTVVGAVSGGDGTITDYVTGVITVVNNVGLSGGTGYNTDGTYTNVALSTNGSGTNATADIVVSSGAVSSVDIIRGGSGYAAGDTLSAADSDIGGRTAGAAFSISITDVEQRLFIDLGAGGIKFSASGANPDFIRDNNSTAVTLVQSYTATQSFDAAADVDMTPNRITITGHGYTNGDPVKYSSGVNLPIGNLANNAVYRVKVIDANIIELYDDYDITTQRLFSSSSSGTHTLTINGVETFGSTFYKAAHGLTTGDALEYTASVTPTGISSGEYFFVGSVTTNSFTLHPSRANALTSVNGITFAKQAVTSQGTGNATLNIHNVQVTTQINTSSTEVDNWSILSSGNIDASNIISGVIDSTRLGTGTANSDTALFGDSEYKLVMKDITNNTADDPITLAGTFFTDGSGNEHYYGSVDIRVEAAGADAAITADANQAYYSKGVAKFLKEHFTNSITGEIGVKPSTQGGTVDAATLGGVARAHYENPENMSRAVPISLGGTNQTAYTKGDILYAATDIDDDLDVLTKLGIGTNGQILYVNTDVPEWTSNPVLDGATFGNIQIAITDDNTIDTTTGNLTLSSSGGDITIAGNLTVTGTTTTVNTETINLADNIIVLNSNLGAGVAPTQNGGISIERGSAADKTFIWNESDDKWTVGSETFVAGTLEGNLEWSYITDKPDPQITVTLTGDVTGTANTTLTDLANGTISVATTVAANSVALGTDTTGNYMVDVSAGNAITVSHTPGEGSTATINHADTSTQASVNNSANDFIQDITLDTYGHVTGLTTATVDMGVESLASDTGVTVSAATGAVTVGHADTSTQSSVNNSNGTVIQDVTLDTFGHITALGSVNLDSRYYTETESDGRFVLETGDTMTGDLTMGDGTGNARIIIKKADNNVSDHIQFFSGTTRMGEIGTQDTTWLRINQVTNKNIYTPRYIRADNGFYVDGTTYGITGAGAFKTADITPNATNTRNVGTSSLRYNTMYATTFDGTATAAQYADLAEKYTADEEYEIGTVIAVGGKAEVTAANLNNAHSVLGVVSEAPAFLMNKDLENGTAIALKGRVPVRITGEVKKGDRLAPSTIAGVAHTNNKKDAWSFAIALHDAKDGIVEAVIL